MKNKYLYASRDLKSASTEYKSRMHVTCNENAREEITFEKYLPLGTRLWLMIKARSFKVPDSVSETWEHKGRVWVNKKTKHLATQDTLNEISDFKDYLAFINKNGTSNKTW